MKKRIPSPCGILSALVLTTLCAALPLNAAQIRVDETGVGPSRQVTISGPIIGEDLQVHAGVLHLVVEGVAMNGFCIDPFHLGIPTSSEYSYINLPDGPKGSAMGELTALYISRLWGSFYSPTMNGSTAAGLQIALWRLTGAGDFVLDSSYDYGAGAMLDLVSNPNYSGPVADLVGLTGPGQDYVVQKVPDLGSTLMLLFLGLCGILALGRQLKPAMV